MENLLLSSWFTQTSLFLFLNLVIGTIVVISRINSHSHRPQQQREEYMIRRQPVRAPSLIDRVKSINFSFYNYQTHETTSDFTHNTHAVVDHRPPQLERGPSLIERVKSIKFPSFYRSEPEDELTGQEHHHGDYHATRSKSESGAVRAREVEASKEKMKKSTSEAEDREGKRPATTRLGKTASFSGEDGGVDAKADDFINKFKQQLKLQRLESLLRYRK